MANPAVISYGMAAQRPLKQLQAWGLDSGSENHLVDERRFTSLDIETDAFIMDRPLKLATANGIIRADHRMKMDVNVLGKTIDPILLENTVDVLSLGRLVIDDGLDFHWLAESGAAGATLVDQSGKTIHCPIKGYVPMLVDTDASDPSAAIPSRITADDERLHVPLPEIELEGDVQIIGLPDVDTPTRDKLREEANSVRHMLTPTQEPAV